MTSTLLAALLLACGGTATDTGTPPTTTVTGSVDADLDGYAADVDCDDANAAVNPGATEVCNGVDDDCDQQVDVGASDGFTAWADADADGYGDPATATQVCALGTGQVDNDGDCDDTEPLAWVGASEVCDGADNDCDGTTDGADAADATWWYVDADTDGFGSPTGPVLACDQPAGHADNDGDCDDGEPRANPGETEVCDGVDNDCDGTTDGATATDATPWYKDLDGDGYGDPAISLTACAPPMGYVDNADDCNDRIPVAWTGATEVCDGVDNDCDGTTDGATAVDALTWYADVDTDGYGSAATTVTACSKPTGYVLNPDDCDDAADWAWTGRVEICDGLDNDCDKLVDGDDPVLDADTWYEDADGDGGGDPAVTLAQCDQPKGYVANDNDCEPTDASIGPFEPEICGDGIDQDCDGGGGVACSLSGTYSLGSAYDAKLRGDAAGAGLSGRVAAPGDLDGDGAAELAVGARNAGSGGRAYVSYGAPTDGVSDLADLPLVLEGDVSGDGLGASIQSAGDNDGDGLVDLVVGAPDSLSAGGTVWVVTGAPTGTLGGADVTASLVGAAGELAGTSLAALSDWDGDTLDELAIGGTGASSGGGQVWVVPGGSTGTGKLASLATLTLYGTSAGDAAGTHVTSLDADGDGVADLATGAPAMDDAATDAGAVYLFLGSLTGVVDVADADLVLLGAAADDRLAFVSSGGDMNADGYDELLLGGDRTDGNGRVWLVTGPPPTGTGDVSAAADVTFAPETTTDDLGGAASSAGDVDGDGRGDFLLGAPKTDGVGTSDGGAYLVYSPVFGTVLLTSADARFYGGANNTLLGTAVAGPGDVDADARNDVWFFAAGDGGNGANSGAAFLVYGLDGM